MDEQRQDDQLEPTYRSSVQIRDVVPKTCRKKWTIEKGGEKGSGIPVPMVRHDDDDDDIYIYIYIYVCVCVCVCVCVYWLVRCLGFISTFVGYLKQNPF